MATANRIEGVVFDLDGVLVDSEIWWDDARRAWAAAHGRPWTEADRDAVMGANGREWSRTMQQRLGVEVEPAVIEAEVVAAVVARYGTEGAPRIPAADDAVRRIAARVPVAVASSAHRDVITSAIRGLGLADRFAAVVSSDEVARGKPAPDVYLEAARRLGLAPERLLVVEDSYNGVLAGRAAGMRVVLVPNATIPPAPGAVDAADAVLGSIGDLDLDAFAAETAAR
ncbi:MAG TPA: HAD family phosphatase [Candidatus Limnocylindrales bacterium]